MELFAKGLLLPISVGGATRVPTFYRLSAIGALEG